MVEKWERWSKEEIAILKKCYPNMPRENLMQLLPGRTWRTICNTASKYDVHRPRYGTTRSAGYLKFLHDRLSIARRRRTAGYAPFAGNHHSADAKLRISVSNLYARFNCVADIAALHGITEKEVREIIEKRGKKRK